MLEVRRLVLILEGDKTYEYMKALGGLDMPGNPSHRLIAGLLKDCPVNKFSKTMHQWCPGSGQLCQEKEGALGGWIIVCSTCERIQTKRTATRHKWHKPPHGEDCRCLGTKDIVISDREWLAVLLDAAKYIGNVTFLQVCDEVILKTHHHGYGDTHALALADAFFSYHLSYRPEE